MTDAIDQFRASESQSGRERARLVKGIRTALNYLLMVGLAAFFIFPLIIMINASLKPERLAQDDLDTIYALIPRQVTLENYSCPTYRQPDSPCGSAPGVLEATAFGQVMLNSVFIVTSIVLLGLFVNSLAGFALARLNWRGRSVAIAVIIALIIIPFESLAVPLLLLVNQLPWIDGSRSWLNTYHVQIIPFVADAFSIFLFYQFFIGIPKDFDEAARVDGANAWQIYARIIVPLARPVFATVAILQFLAQWGSFLWPLMVTQGPNVRPLPLGMSILFSQQPVQWGDIMAFASLVTLPVLFIFLLFQKWFIQSVASSGVKG
jgi:multiple sugar transport system permease protein